MLLPLLGTSPQKNQNRSAVWSASAIPCPKLIGTHEKCCLPGRVNFAGHESLNWSANRAGNLGLAAPLFLSPGLDLSRVNNRKHAPLSHTNPKTSQPSESNQISSRWQRCHRGCRPNEVVMTANQSSNRFGDISATQVGIYGERISKPTSLEMFRWCADLHRQRRRITSH